MQEELRSRLVTLLRCYIVTLLRFHFRTSDLRRLQGQMIPKNINEQTQYCSSFVLPFYNARPRTFFRMDPLLPFLDKWENQPMT